MLTVASPTILSRVLLMAEANFIRNEMLNINQRTWADDNQHFLKKNTIPIAVCNKCLSGNNW
jgi:sulfur relay (sulfurtransferase) complex TusBCD TusD component (DsrE family)